MPKVSNRRQDRWALRMREAGKCALCGKPRNKKRSTWYCTECLEKNNNARKLKRKISRLDELQKEVEQLSKPTKRKR